MKNFIKISPSREILLRKKSGRQAHVTNSKLIHQKKRNSPPPIPKNNPKIRIDREIT
jgi:hypothetical protein